MDSTTHERFVAALKADLSRDHGVLGLVAVGPQSKDVKMDDLLLIVRDDRVAQYEGDSEWLPFSNRQQSSAAVPGQGRITLYRDGHTVRTRVSQIDRVGDYRITEKRILLDRGGIARLLKAVAEPQGSDVAQIALAIWHAFQRRASGLNVEARQSLMDAISRMDSEHAVEELDGPFATVCSVALGELSTYEGAEAHSGLLGAIQGWIEAAEPVEAASGSAARISAGLSSGTLSGVASGTSSGAAPGAMSGVAPRAASGVAPRAVSGGAPGAASGGGSAGETLPVSAVSSGILSGRKTPIPAPGTSVHTCAACGTAIGGPGKIYVKGTLNDIRFLEDDAPRLDMKQHVSAWACPVCGDIRLQLNPKA